MPMIKKYMFITCILTSSMSICMEKTQSAEQSKSQAELSHEQALSHLEQSKSEQDLQQKHVLLDKYRACLNVAARDNHIVALKLLLSLCFNKSVQTADIEAKIKLLDEALTYGLKLADLGCKQEQFIIACIYEEKSKWLFKKNQSEACVIQMKKWLTKAAQDGHAAAQSNLGILLCTQSDEVNGQKDKKKLLDDGLYWLRRAAEQGDLQAENNLGTRFYAVATSTTDANERDAALRNAELCYQKVLNDPNLSNRTLYNLGLVYRFKSTVIDADQQEVYLDKALECFLKVSEHCLEEQKYDVYDMLAEVYEKKYVGAASPEKQDEFLDRALFWGEKHITDLKKRLALAHLYEKKIAGLSDPHQKLQTLDKEIALLIEAPKSAEALDKLAICYWQKSLLINDGQEKEKLLLKAEETYFKLAPQRMHDSRFQNNLGYICKQISDCKTDPSQKKQRLDVAVKWLLQSANQGNKSAAKTLAEIKSQRNKEKGCVSTAP